VIYLDHNATTPVAEEVTEAVARALREQWGNPSSSHGPGRAALAAMENARRQVADLLGCGPDEILFTSGGTESDNIALLGVARGGRRKGRVVISAVEHPAVEEAARVLEREGHALVRVPVGPNGVVDPSTFVEALDDDTAVASLMHANNETGALQPVAEVGRAARARGIPFHTDAAQSVGKLAVNVNELNVDLLTVASHKLYGPKGVGALYVRPGVEIAPLLHGAPQEGGRRPGTENTPGIVGLGAACALAARELTRRVEHARRLTGLLLARLQAALPGLELNGPADPAGRLPNTLNVSIPGTASHLLAASLAEVAVSSGAACHSGTPEPSAVLLAMGLDRERAGASVRISTGRGNTEAEMERAAEIIAAAARLPEDHA
jgi:cysteine desulfurase